MECDREQEVLLAARFRGWRETCDSELRRHVDECEVCRDLVAITEVFRDDHDLAMHEPQLPAAGQVWWRAAVRARAESAEAAVRPLTWVHGIAGACVVGLCVAAIGLAWPTAMEWTSSLVFRVNPDGIVAELVTAARTRLPLLLTVAALIVLTPIALYLALSDDEEGGWDE